MFVAINMDSLGFMHKHHDQDTCAGLSWLECGQQVSVRNENIESDDFLRGVSHGDLLRLYKNVTGIEPIEHSWGERAFHFREHLREVARTIPVTTALIEEVEAQTDAVYDRLHNGERFKYALGAKLPAQPVDLFTASARALNKAQMAQADARANARVQAFKDQLVAEKEGYQGAPSKPWEGPAAPVDAQPAQEPDTAVPASRKAKAATGSVRPVIRARADVAWNDRGEQDWKTIKTNLMKELEAEGYHPTTIRIKLNEWAKDNSVA